MESGVSSSFIPKDAKVADAFVATTVRHSGGGLGELLVLASVVLMVASGALAAAVFGYQQFLIQQNLSKLDSLKRAEAAFDPALIQQITRLDDRMYAADQILATHLAPSAFLRTLDQLTLTTVGYTSLNAQVVGSGEIALKMSGVGQSVNSVALQAQLFGKSPTIANPIFSSIDRQVNGVHFNVTASIRPSSIIYGQISSLPSAPSPAPTSPSGGVTAPVASSTDTSASSSSVFTQ